MNVLEGRLKTQLKILEIVKANEGISTKKIADKLGMAASSVRGHMDSLVLSEHVEITNPVDKVRNSSNPTRYKIVPGKPPLKAALRNSKSGPMQLTHARDFSRIVIKAKQIGMHRCEFECYLFGMPTQASA